MTRTLNPNFSPALTFDDDDDRIDAEIEQFHAGYRAFLAGQPRPADATQAEGWEDAQRASRVCVVMPARPEGYYHAPIGAFD